jgi:hypothetical protein
MKHRVLAGLALAPALLFTLSGEAGAPDPRAEHNLVLVTFDGVRVEEMFGGLDAAVLEGVLREKGRSLRDSATYHRFRAPTREERRLRLLPFFWGVLMRSHGSIAGDRDRGSHVRVANAHRLSYPGYAEMLTGDVQDDVIRDNEPRRNPHPSVLETLARELRLRPEQAAVFASWDTMGLVVESAPGRLFVNAGPVPYAHHDPLVRRLSELQFDTPTPWERVRPDAYTFEFALTHLRTHRPRVLYIALDETDDLAHDGRYEAVLEALHRYDRWLARLWEQLQADPFYRGRTSLVVSVDHGRGRTPQDWRHHGAGIAGSEDVWLAVAGPDTARRGDAAGPESRAHGELAGTLAGLMGVDLRAAASARAAARPYASADLADDRRE